MAYLVLPPEFVPFLSTVVNWTICFTPLISYGSTAISIRQNRSSAGFSIDICATMLLASTLRIFYYYVEPYEISLLRQCFSMVFIQIILLHTALKYRTGDGTSSLEIYDAHWGDLYENAVQMADQTTSEFRGYDSSDFKEVLAGFWAVSQKSICRVAVLLSMLTVKVFKVILSFFDAHYIRPFKFWQWGNPHTYWRFLASFLGLFATLQIFLHNNYDYGMFLATASFLIESSLPLPQIMLFQRVQTTQNFKPILLVTWLAGDVTKISYLVYGTTNVGLIFIVAALFQMSLNLTITYLFFKYRRMDQMVDGLSDVEMGRVRRSSSLNGDRLRSDSIKLPVQYNIEEHLVHEPPRPRASTLETDEDFVAVNRPSTSSSIEQDLVDM